ncbi:MAG: DUF3467 domain-containing protein [Candidatus Paceibacterota bacterium]|jgi:hypothetical protein
MEHNQQIAPQNAQQLQIKVNDSDLKGVYSNLMQIVHTKEEFVFDFFLNAPPQGLLVSRAIVNPAHAKRIALALAENIKRYEEKFGAIKEGESPEGKIGFVK